MTTTSIPDRTLQPGEAVDIHLRGARVSWTHNGETTFELPTETDNVRSRYLHLYLDDLAPDTVSVHRRIPVDGAPQPGDVWADALGNDYWARAAKENSVWLVNRSGHAEPWLQVHTGGAGPITLEYRPDRGTGTGLQRTPTALPAASAPPALPVSTQDSAP